MNTRLQRVIFFYMNTRRLFSAVTLLLVITFVISAESAAGIISYLEGSVQVSRNGSYLSRGNIDIGLKIEASDTIETGPDGYVEVEMNAPSAGSVVKVRSDSSFYFESSPEGAPRKETIFQMLRGALSLKVGRLSSRESYKVQTDSAVMAVRGTEFNVDMSADRSVLVTVPEGHVESKSGRTTIMAQPGTVAAVDNDSQISSIKIAPEDINLYRQYWQGLRLDALKINAKLSIQQFSRQWDQQLPRLESAMAELKSQQAVISHWEQIDQGNANIPPTADIIRDKRALSPGMLELRAILPVAERTFNTLLGLEEAYNQGFAEGPFQSGNYRDAATFYRSFSGDKEEVRDMLARARYLMRVYKVLDGSAGGGIPSSNAPDIMSTPSF